MNILDWSQGQILILSLIVLRLLAFFFSSAIFGAPQVMVQLKVLLSLVMAFVFYPMISAKYNPLEFVGMDFISAAAREVCVGICLGFLTKIFFYAVSAAGEVIATSLGLASAALFNPMLGSSGTIIEKFHSTLAVLLFLSLNGHHHFIEVIMKSFEMFPLQGAFLHLESFANVALVGHEVLVLTVKMSAPMMVAMLISNMGMGILGRAVPQINVLVTSFSVAILLGLGLMLVSLPLSLTQMMGMMGKNIELLYDFLKVI